MGMSSDFDINKHDSRFLFQRRFQKVDWKKIAAVNVDNIVQELDFKVLQDNISSVTFCNIENEVDIKTVDPNFIKLFKLAQLTIEYLLHSQDYLTGIINILEDKLRKLQDELEEIQREKNKDAQILSELQNEKKRNKKLLLKQQEHLLNENVPTCYRCLYCSKKFFTSQFLHKHVLRRHADQAGHFNTLNMHTENIMHPSVPQSLNNADNKVVEMVEKELIEIKQMLRKSDHIQATDDTSQNAASICHNKAQQKDNELTKDIEMWRQEIEKHKKDLNNMCDMFMSELREINEKHQKYDRSIAELKQLQNSLPRKLSFVTEPLSENKEINAAENSVHKENIKEMFISMESSVHDILRKQEKKWEQRVSDLKYEQQSELKKISHVFRNAISDLHTEFQSKGLHEQKIEDKLQEIIKKPQSMLHKNDKNKQTSKSSSMSYEWSSTPLKHSPPSPPPRSSTLNVTSVEKFPQKSINKYGMERSEKLSSAIKNTPNLLAGLLPDLKGLVDDKLEQCGIKPQLPVMSNSFLNKKLNILQKEKDSLAERYKEFSMLRKYYNSLADDIAKSKLQELIKDKHQPSLRISGSVESPVKQVLEIHRTKEDPVKAQSESRENTGKIPPKPLPRRLTFAEPAAQTLDGALDASAKTKDLKPPPVSPIPRKPPAVMKRQMSLHSHHTQKTDVGAFYPSDSSDDFESTNSSVANEEPKVVHVKPTSKTNVAFKMPDSSRKTMLNSTEISVASHILKHPSQSEKDEDEVSSLFSDNDSEDHADLIKETNKSGDKKIFITSNTENTKIAGSKTVSGQLSSTSSGKNTLTSVSSWDSEDELSMEEIK